ncbi:MAG: glycosyltransferase family 9 protein [Nitrospira sp.]|nr:glycosyltransferase family 9 protein [Nitrospira sp.]
MRKAVLVIHPGALGDVLLAVPALQRLRADYPNHRYVLASHELVGRFLLECNVVEEWISFESIAIRNFLFGEESFPSSEKCPWIQHCEFAIGWLKDDDGLIANRLKMMGISHVRIGSPFDPNVTATHQSDRFCEAIGEQGHGPAVVPRIRIPSVFKRSGEVCLTKRGIALDRPMVMIHPGSGSRAKCTRPEVLASVIDKLQNAGTQCLLLEGPADQEAVKAVIGRTGRPLPVLRDADLTTVAGVLLRARVYIGHDSGITHLAGLLGVPTVALFGPTDPARWAPKGPHVIVLRGVPCECPSWEHVTACSEKICLAISPKQILDACRKHDHLITKSQDHGSDSTLSLSDPCAKVARSFSPSLLRT